jgi:cytochrome c oxidase subunit II
MASGNDTGSFWMPPQASTVAADVDGLYNFVLWLNIIFFVLITAGTVWLVIRYRRRSNDQYATAQIAHSTWFEALWTFGPLALLVIVFVWGTRVFMDLAVAPEGAYTVQVQAKKWSWTFTHPNGAVVPGELEVPAGRPVRLVMASQDVLHSFFVPDFRVKQDVVPGRLTSLWFEAKAPGEHQIFCTEYCGKDHSRMLAKVKVIAADVDYRGPQTGKPAEVSLEDWGKQLYTKFGCNACHSVDGAKGVGPSFKGLYGKQEALASGGTVLVDENYIMESIYDPNAKLVAGYAGGMPTFKGQIDSEGIQSIIAFIKTLK